MINNFLGIRYGRGCLKVASESATGCAPDVIKQMFPDAQWTMVTPGIFDANECVIDRFGENFKIQQKIYNATPHERHILIGGDHSVNYGHFVALANQMPDSDLCLVYIDAHMDLHTPETSVSQASGAPHGTNVRALLGNGDKRWLTLQNKRPALRPENLFYFGTRSTEPAETDFATQQNIYVCNSMKLQNESDVSAAITEVRNRIGNRPFVVSFDFDVIDPSIFCDTLVPAPGGISVDTAVQILRGFQDANYFEFVEYAPSGDTASANIVHQLIEMAQNTD